MSWSRLSHVGWRGRVRVWAVVETGAAHRRVLGHAVGWRVHEEE